MFSKRSIFAAGLVLAAMTTAACTRADRTYTDSATGTVATPEAVRIDDVTLGKGLGADKKVLDATDSFSPMDTIRATVKTTGVGLNALLNARWMYQDSVLVEEQSQTISPTGDTWTEFHITKATAWPKGKYRLVVSLNGREIEAENFSVK